MRGIRSIILLVVFAFWAQGLSAQQASSQGIPKKEWTILVYLNADNNLEDFGFEDVHEMEKVGSNDRVNIVVQFDGITKSGTQRLYIEKALQAEGKYSFASPVVEDMPEQDMGDISTFVNFVEWGMKHYPADHYMTILWNHGSGWSKRSEELSLMKGISYDDTSGTHITTNQLADGLDQILMSTGNKIDVLGFDACLMAMYEIADSLSGMVDYLVASEETEPGEGYAYHDLLSIFEGDRAVSPATLAKHAVIAYGKSYLPGGSQGPAPSNSSNSNNEWSWGSRAQEVTSSAIDLSKMELVKKRLNTWVEIMMSSAALKLEDIKWAANKAVDFAEPSYKDLGHFVKLVLEKAAVSLPSGRFTAESTPHSGLISASLALLKAIQAAVIENYTTDKFKNATGLSIYLPYSYWGGGDWQKTSRKRNQYLDLKWSQSTRWHEFLDHVLLANTPSSSQDEEPVSVPVAEGTSTESF